MGSFELGFKSLDTEIDNKDLKVEGNLPTWLTGSLYRNGPALFEVNGERMNHWFDGLGMIHRYNFSNGGVSYTNRFLRSKSYNKVVEHKKLPESFASSGSGLLDLLRGILIGKPPDNANVHVSRLADRHVALTETPGWKTFDPVTLQTVDSFNFEDDINLHWTTAHLHYDRKKSETVGYGIRFGRKSKYIVYSVSDGLKRREKITSIQVDNPAYMHSCALTQNYVILTEIPYKVSPIDLLTERKGFIQSFRWEPSQGTKIYIIDRSTGSMKETKIEPFFAFHHVSAYEKGDSLIIDIVTYPDDSIIESVYLDELDEDSIDIDDGRFQRFRIGLDGEVRRSEILYEGIELPRVAPSVHTTEHRYAYGQATRRDGQNGVVKIDVKEEKNQEWWGENVYAEEPIFVSGPSGSGEDEGILIFTALDTDAERSMLILLEASSMEERARVILPHHVPFGFHGMYFSDC